MSYTMSNHVAWATHGHLSRLSSLPSYPTIHTVCIKGIFCGLYIIYVQYSNCYIKIIIAELDSLCYLYASKHPPWDIRMGFINNNSTILPPSLFTTPPKVCTHTCILYIQQIFNRHVQTAIVIHKQVMDAMSNILYIILPCTHYKQYTIMGNVQ